MVNRKAVKLLAQKADLGETQILPSISAYASPLEQVEAVLEKATDVHDYLCTAGEWMTADKSGAVEDIAAVSYVPSTYWNCGKKNCNTRQESGDPDREPNPGPREYASRALPSELSRT